jgi:hypothetical protein
MAPEGFVSPSKGFIASYTSHCNSHFWIIDEILFMIDGSASDSAIATPVLLHLA